MGPSSKIKGLRDSKEPEIWALESSHQAVTVIDPCDLMFSPQRTKGTAAGRASAPKRREFIARFKIERFSSNLKPEMQVAQRLRNSPRPLPGSPSVIDTCRFGKSSG